MSHPDTNWMSQAACRGHNPETFFPSATGAGARIQAERAARICADCPVTKQCKQFGNGYIGVWGGEHNPVGNRAPAVANRDLKPHGTEAAYRRHQRNGEPPCPTCIRGRAVHR